MVTTDQLAVGFARTAITPPVGTRLAGTLREGGSRAIERDLTASALVLSLTDNRVALIACDVIRLPPAGATALRQRVAERLGISVSNVLINTSHTHATVDAPGYHMHDDSDPPDEERALRDYWATVESQVVGVALAADSAREPARYGVGVGSARIGVNRREQLPDGTMVLGENPNGVVDPSVNVIRFDALDGQPIALLLSYACHPDVLGPKCELVSPDYVGVARTTAESITGAPTIFFQGAAGDIDPRCGIVLGEDGVEEMRRLGTELGCEAARVHQGIYTLRRRDRRVAWQSASSVVTAWSYADADTPAAQYLGAASRVLSMPLRPLPDEPTAQRSLEEYEGQLRALDPGTSALADRLVAQRRVSWAELQLDAVRRGTPDRLDLEMQVIRLDDVALVAIPGELFVEIGLGIKARSRLPHTLVLGYSNGTYFYIPTAAAFPYGGYEIESYRNYQQPAGPTPEWESLLTNAACDMIDSLSSDKTHGG